MLGKGMRGGAWSEASTSVPEVTWSSSCGAQESGKGTLPQCQALQRQIQPEFRALVGPGRPGPAAEGRQRSLPSMCLAVVRLGSSLGLLLACLLTGLPARHLPARRLARSAPSSLSLSLHPFGHSCSTLALFTSWTPSRYPFLSAGNSFCSF